MALEQHYGYQPGQTGTLFAVGGLELVRAHKFQLGLNNLFVFRKTAACAETLPTMTREGSGSHELTAVMC
jgi:hypothetical protein